MKTIHIEGFCKIIAASETRVSDNGQFGEDASRFMTAKEANSGHRVWYVLDSDGDRTPITGDVKTNCAIIMQLEPTRIRQLIGDVNELRLVAKPHEIKWVCDRIRDAERRVRG